MSVLSWSTMFTITTTRALKKIKAYYFLFMLMVTDKKQQGKKAFIVPNTKFIYWKSWRSWLSWFSMRSFCTLKLKDSHDCNILLYHSKSHNQLPLSLDVVVVVFLQGWNNWIQIFLKLHISSLSCGRRQKEKEENREIYLLLNYFQLSNLKPNWSINLSPWRNRIARSAVTI